MARVTCIPCFIDGVVRFFREGPKIKKKRNKKASELDYSVKVSFGVSFRAKLRQRAGNKILFFGILFCSFFMTAQDQNTQKT
jgi:hypothetical protein